MIMKHPENENWLDDVLSETIGSEKPKADFEQWKQQHPDAVEMLTSKAGRDSSISKGPLSIRDLRNKARRLWGGSKKKDNDRHIRALFGLL